MQILSIGRDATNEIILNNNFVSRQHAQLQVLDNGQIIIKDLGSSNGTFVNGNQISECYLKPGDVLLCAKMQVNWNQYIPHVYKEQLQHKEEYKVQVQAKKKPAEQTHQAVKDVEQQSLAMRQGHGQPNVIVVGKQKSVGVAFLLTFLFGPLGLLYASVLGGIIMFFVGILLFFLIPIVGGIISWVICMIWAVVAANDANSKMVSSVRNQF